MSALSNPLAVEAKFIKELKAKHMLSPFPNPVFQEYCVSSVGLTKKKEPEKFKVFHDLSAHFCQISVNSYIPTEDGSVSYHSVDTAVAFIQDLGSGYVPCKTVVKHADKLISIHMDDIPALGL